MIRAALKDIKEEVVETINNSDEEFVDMLDIQIELVDRVAKIATSSMDGIVDRYRNEMEKAFDKYSDELMDLENE